ncbi:hypothetical protein GJ496_000217 [Pomphorhynchus laevis]|nr:hypothetical protein GJ496_000217 [Pomphorhynchus laevis]
MNDETEILELERGCADLHNMCYNEIIHWRPNLCKIPNCNERRKFITPLNSQYENFVNRPDDKPLALRIATVMGHLILMSMWMDGDIPELYKEAKYLQNRITSRLHHTKNQSILVKNFTKLVVSGKLSTARQFLSSRGSRACILDLDHKIENVSVLQKLISLHPAPAEVADQYVLSKPVTGYQEHHAVRLSKVAKCDSQVAYTMLTKSLQNQWKYLQRTCEINSEWLNPLSEMIFKKLVPEIIGIPNIDMELRIIICLPLRLGGMGVSEPSTEPKTEFDRSQRMISPIINANRSISQKSIAIEIHKENNNMQKLQILTESKSPTLQNSIKHACLKGASSWLSTLPIEHKEFHLRKRAFQDAIAVTYGWDPINLPRKCSFIPKTNVIHAIKCKIGGLPMIRHDIMREAVADE